MSDKEILSIRVMGRDISIACPLRIRHSY